MRPQHEVDPSAVREAFELLGVRNVVFGIHSAAFPGRPDEDLGRGSVYSSAAWQLLEWVAGLGFNAVQLGPMGLTGQGNASPYDGTVFSRNPLDLPASVLVDEGLVERSALEPLLGAPVERVEHSRLFPTQDRLLEAAFEVFRCGPRAAQARAFQRANSEWLLPDAIFEVLCREHGRGDMRLWPARDREMWSKGNSARKTELVSRNASTLERYAFEQYLLEGLHTQLRARCVQRGLRLFGDLQVGLSTRDVWREQACLLPGYALGAPPSRTTPEGQPWGYAVLDPDQYRGSGGAALEFFRRRLERVFSDFDGLRVDHPHGLVDPWVYKLDESDRFEAVRAGARLFSALDLPDHPSLARFCLVGAYQIDESKARHADDRVRCLDEAQVAAYSTLVDELVAALRRHGRDPADLACEVLSTLPYPLARVLERHRLGRFRVLQKADFGDASDVYRPENVQRGDWIMLGTHDTPSIWQRVAQWELEGSLEPRAAHLAQRLAPEPRRKELYSRLRASPGLLAHALLADALARRPRHLYVFFMDLLGLSGAYNVPGTIDDSNWSLRVPADYRAEYPPSCIEHRALDLPTVLSLALQAPHCEVRATAELQNALTGPPR